MRQTPNWKQDIDLTNKCGSCKHYVPYIKKEVLTARGHCTFRRAKKMMLSGTVKI